VEYRAKNVGGVENDPFNKSSNASNESNIVKESSIKSGDEVRNASEDTIDIKSCKQ